LYIQRIAVSVVSVATRHILKKKFQHEVCMVMDFKKTETQSAAVIETNKGLVVL
jgi:hypothetical protein